MLLTTTQTSVLCVSFSLRFSHGERDSLPSFKKSCAAWRTKQELKMYMINGVEFRIKDMMKAS
jgi:hypothetical protein